MFKRGSATDDLEPIIETATDEAEQVIEACSQSL